MVFKTALVVALAGLAAGTASAQLVGIDWTTDNLWDISTANGSRANPRATTLSGSPVGFTFGATASVGYIITTFGDNALYRVNPATGATVRVGATGLTSIIEGDLRYNRQTNTLWGFYDSGGDRAFTVNVNTGQAQLAGSFAALDDISGLDFDSAGNAWILEARTNSTGNSIMRRVDLNAGTVFQTVTLDRRFAPLAGIAFDNNNRLYAVSGAGGNSNLYTINLTSGATSLVGDTGLNQWSGLAFIPAPGTLALLGLGGLIASRRRR